MTWAIITATKPQQMLGGEYGVVGLARLQAQFWADARQEKLLVVEMPEYDSWPRKPWPPVWPEGVGEPFEPRKP